jgi:hypothetical protein
MKNSNSASRLILLAFAAISLALVASVHAGAGPEYSRSELMGNSGLSIFRAADFGNHLGLCIYLDGIPITTLSRGEGYRAIVRPGHHRLTITDTPSPYGILHIEQSIWRLARITRLPRFGTCRIFCSKTVAINITVSTASSLLELQGGQRCNRR